MAIFSHSDPSFLRHKLLACTKLLLCSIPICGRPPPPSSNNYGQSHNILADIDSDTEDEVAHILPSPLILGSSSRSSLKYSDSSNSSHGHGSHTPRGCLAVYAGEEEDTKRLFFVEAEMVNHPLFGVLLDMAKEEFGFQQKGPLYIPCDSSLFHHVLLLLRSNDPSSLRNAESLLRSAQSPSVC